MNLRKPDNKDIRIPPLVSSADANEGNYARGRIDNDLDWYISYIAYERANKEETRTWSHRVGFAGELVTAAYFDVPVNDEIYPKHIGDDGYDLVYNGYTLEVKTVTRDDGFQLKVREDQIEVADYFVLARCSNPSELVELIGWVKRDELLEHGYQFSGDDLVRLDATQLALFEPVFLCPERIKESQRQNQPFETIHDRVITDTD